MSEDLRRAIAREHALLEARSNKNLITRSSSAARVWTAVIVTALVATAAGIGVGYFLLPPDYERLAAGNQPSASSSPSASSPSPSPSASQSEQPALSVPADTGINLVGWSQGGKEKYYAVVATATLPAGVAGGAGTTGGPEMRWWLIVPATGTKPEFAQETRWAEQDAWALPSSPMMFRDSSLRAVGSTKHTCAPIHYVDKEGGEGLSACGGLIAFRGDGVTDVHPYALALSLESTAEPTEFPVSLDISAVPGVDIGQVIPGF